MYDSSSTSSKGKIENEAVCQQNKRETKNRGPTKRISKKYF
jgi:hypothetical protein